MSSLLRHQTAAARGILRRPASRLVIFLRRMAPPPPPPSSASSSPSRAAASTVLDARALARTLRRIADEIVELNDGTDGLVIVGIQRRGVQLAARIVSLIAERERV